MSDQMKEIAEKAQKALAVVNETLDEKSMEQRIRGAVDPLLDARLNAANEEFDKKYAKWDEMYSRVETEMKGLTSKIERLGALQDNDGRSMSQLTVDHRKSFYRDYVRDGNDHSLKNFISENAELKALTVTDDAQAGYMLSPATLEAEVARIITETSPVRQFASVRSSNSLTYERRVNVGGGAAVWEDSELDTPTENAQQSYRLVKFDAQALRALYIIGPNMLDDAVTSMEQEFAQEMGIQFAVAEGQAYISGNGVGKPRGFLTYTNTASGSYTGAWETVEYHATGASGAFQAAGSGPEEVFINTIHSLKDGYRAGARFLMNRLTLGEVRKIKDADGRPLFMWDGTMPGNIAGEPFSILQDMPDIAADSYSIAYGNLERAYQIVDRAGISILRDPYSSKPQVEFLGRKRTGGAMKMFEALKLIRFSA